MWLKNKKVLCCIFFFVLLFLISLVLLYRSKNWSGKYVIEKDITKYLKIFKDDNLKESERIFTNDVDVRKGKCRDIKRMHNCFVGSFFVFFFVPCKGVKKLEGLQGRFICNKDFILELPDVSSLKIKNIYNKILDQISGCGIEVKNFKIHFGDVTYPNEENIETVEIDGVGIDEEDINFIGYSYDNVVSRTTSEQGETPLG